MKADILSNPRLGFSDKSVNHSQSYIDKGLFQYLVLTIVDLSAHKNAATKGQFRC